MKEKNNKKQKKIVLLLLILLAVSVGFALLSTTLKINGTANIKGNTWDIHWENVVPNQESTVTAQTPTISNDGKTVTYDVSLELPGDFYEFTVDAKNDGTVNGIIDDIRHTVKEVTIVNNEEVETTATLPSYIIYTIYYDGTTTAPAKNDLLLAGKKKTYRVRIEYDRNSEILASADKVYRITDEVDYIQTKEDGCPTPVSFSADAWSTIACNVKKGNLSAYSIGDTKVVPVKMDFGNGEETRNFNVRIANLLADGECKTNANYSQTACGFVVEFADVVVDRVTMNPTGSGQAAWGTNDTSWNYSYMKSYVDNTLLPALPEDLQEVIATTKTVTGYGENGSSNFVSTNDKLYLLSPKEVWGESQTSEDTAASLTRQLKYYSDNRLYT